jgi:hypothetical protein
MNIASVVNACFASYPVPWPLTPVPLTLNPNPFLSLHQRSVNGQQGFVGILVIDDAGDIDL